MKSQILSFDPLLNQTPTRVPCPAKKKKQCSINHLSYKEKTFFYPTLFPKFSHSRLWTQAKHYYSTDDDAPPH